MGDPDDLSDLIYGPEIPRKLDDYIYTDRPELGLRIVSFSNSTIVVLHWMHLSFDALAKRALLEAWVLMLQGRENEIPTPLAAEDYTLENCGKNPTERHVLADRHISKPGVFWWVLQNAYGLMFRKKEHRMVCVPGTYLAKLRAKALADLAAEQLISEKAEAPFLTEGDVLVAWLSRLAVANAAENSTVGGAFYPFSTPHVTLTRYVLDRCTAGIRVAARFAGSDSRQSAVPEQLRRLPRHSDACKGCPSKAS